MILLNIVNVILHCIGSYLLIHLYKHGTKTVQQTYLINLSLTEILACLMILGEDVMEFTPVDVIIIGKMSKYFHIIVLVTCCCYYWSIVLITSDRLAATILHIKYPLYCDKNKAKYIVVGTWTFALVTSVTISIAYYLTRFDFKMVFTTYTNTVFNFGFIIFVIFTYSYIFHKYKLRQRALSANNRQSILQLFRNSKFYVSILLAITFLLFMVTPNFILLFYELSHSDDKHTVRDATKVFYQFSFLSDACVYIFMQPAVRRLFLLKTGIRRQSISTLFVHRNVLGKDLIIPNVGIATTSL